MATATALPCFSLGLLGGKVRSRSPRMMTSAWMTVLPPRMMFVVPIIWERRDTLLPVSWRAKLGLDIGSMVKGGLEKGIGLLSRCTRPLQAFWTSCLHIKFGTRASSCLLYSRGGSWLRGSSKNRRRPPKLLRR